MNLNVVYDPDAYAYFTARPSLTNAQKLVFDRYFRGMRSDGTRSLVLFALPLVGGAFSDVFTTTAGTAVTNVNFVSGDFNPTGSTPGLVGDGSTKYINTLVRNDAVWQAATDPSFAIAVFITTTTTTNGADFCFGRDGGNTLGPFQYFSTNTYGFGGAQFVQLAAAAINGVYCVSRTSATSLTYYRRGRSIGTNTNNDTGAPANASETGVVFANRASATTVATPSNRRIAFALVTSGLTVAQENLIEGRINQLLNDLGASPYIIAGPYISAYQPTSAEILNLMQSTDGITFSYLPCTLVPTVGSVRDPSLRITSDFWRVIHTSCGFNDGTSFGVTKAPAHSGAFVTIANVDCSSISGVNRVWGPKYYQKLDGTFAVCFSISTAGNGGPFTPYEVHPTNADETTWSTPVLVTGAGIPSSFIDQFIFFNPADPTNYYMVGKNEDTKQLLILRSASDTSSWVVWQDEATHDSGDAESCSIVYISGTTFREYAFRLPATGMSYRDSTDGMATWGVWDQVVPPVPQQSGTFLKTSTP